MGAKSRPNRPSRRKCNKINRLEKEARRPKASQAVRSRWEPAAEVTARELVVSVRCYYRKISRPPSIRAEKRGDWVKGACLLGTPKRSGDARVSTVDQSLEIQEAVLKAAGCEVIR